MEQQKCATCYGQGVVTGSKGPAECGDCGGLGQLPSTTVLTERRLRELEKVYGSQGGEVGQDVTWLVSEVRRARHALTQILALGQDGGAADMAERTRFLANQALGVYPVVPD